ncbi:MAG: flagellar motor protein MotB [Planctomycetota bacterium]
MAIEEDPEPGIPEWVVTFGDMMSLLLTFFIMLVSMSEIKEDQKYMAMVESFREQFGHDLSTTAMVPGESTVRGAAMPHPMYSMGRNKRMDTKNGGQEVKAVTGENERVQIVRPGDDSSIGGVIYFEEDATLLTEANKWSLQRIIEQIAGKPQKIEVRGHASRKPMGQETEFQDAYDLAYARCRSTRQFLIEQGIDPSRIRLTAAGSNEPLYTGVDRDRLKLNSRVQVMMWDERVGDLEGKGRDEALLPSEL